MGKCVELSCECGYKKQFNIGAGLLSINESVVRKSFSEDELADFNLFMNGDGFKKFFNERSLALCEHCNDLTTVNILHYGDDNTIISKCSACGNEVSLIDYNKDEIKCPVCSKNISKNVIGHWD